jgi:hypothetical protein
MPLPGTSDGASRTRTGDLLGAIGRAPGSNHVDLQGFRLAPAGFGPARMPGDCRRLPGVCPRKRRFGGKRRRRVGKFPAAYRGPGYLELIALVPAEPGVPRHHREVAAALAHSREHRRRCSVSTRSRSDRRRRRAMHSRSSLAEQPGAATRPPLRGPSLRGRRAIAERPSASLSGRLLREAEGGEHSSTELAISFKVPCQECGRRGYVETVNEDAHVLATRRRNALPVAVEAPSPTTCPPSQFRELLASDFGYPFL